MINRPRHILSRIKVTAPSDYAMSAFHQKRLPCKIFLQHSDNYANGQETISVYGTRKYTTVFTGALSRKYPNWSRPLCQD
jgi:hypothetical protein